MAVHPVTNQKVLTPLGAGIVQGPYGSSFWIMRLPVNEITKAVISPLTPHARASGLWIFPEGELK